MTSKLLRKAAFGTAVLLSTGSVSVTSALAQDTRALTENISLIRGCRQLNTSVAVFDNSALRPISNRIGTLAAGTRVTLTGAVSPGRAQVFLSSGSLSSVQPVGWLDASRLGPCSNTPPPARGACFRADQELVVRSGPSTGFSVVAGYNRNNLVVASTNPPTQQTSSGDRRIWMQVRVSNSTSGWIARTGPNGLGSNITPTNCP